MLVIKKFSVKKLEFFKGIKNMEWLGIFKNYEDLTLREMASNINYYLLLFF